MPDLSFLATIDSAFQNSGIATATTTAETGPTKKAAKKMAPKILTAD
jgi:hypothetical protein